MVRRGALFVCRIAVSTRIAMDAFFTRIATRSASIMGQPAAFVISTLLVIIWAASGPALHYSDTWQLIVNTATTVLTFLAVFLIQNSQNRDGAAMQAKLDEILRALDKARVEFVGIEHLTDAQICEIRTALEKDIEDEGDKSRTTGRTVEKLLARY
jgi:low affinity Fe/Cu permease